MSADCKANKNVESKTYTAHRSSAAYLPMTIMQTGMTMVMLQAMVQPMVPSSSRITFTTKSMAFLEALCVSLIRPNSES